MTTMYDFGGYATKNDLVCSDGRIIRRDAFKHNDGATVPLVWDHAHNDPEYVIGHALLQNREDGVYALCTFNGTKKALHIKELVVHKDVKSLSIYANQLIHKGKEVVHGEIREVSIVLVGANPGAKIENLFVAHSDNDDDLEELMTEAIIHSGLTFQLADEFEEVLEHADASTSEEETVGDVFNTLTEKQKIVVYAMVAEVAKKTTTDTVAESTPAESDAKHSDNEGTEMTIHHNVFEKKEEAVSARNTLSHSQLQNIFEDAKTRGSLRDSVLAHAGTYGIADINFLFPDAKTLDTMPTFISRRTEWVKSVIDGAQHTPFSRIKTIQADITADEARAKGYVKGALKVEEVFKLLKRITNPTTIYKKQKLDRDDIIDITGFDVVSWMKMEMRVMWDEELARAILVSDGRAIISADKINEDNIRPIWTDDNLYAHHIRMTAVSTTEDIIEGIIRARENYRGSGNPTMFCGVGLLTDMLLLKGTDGHRIYRSQAELEAELRVGRIVEVDVMTGLTRESDDQVPVDLNLLAIIVNMKDYAIGADKGGALSFFDDFDIDYNQMKYLLEARCCGALTLPKSALVIEQVAE